MLETGRWQAIVKTLSDGRRMFCGIERSKKSRKSALKYMCPPQDLERLVRDHKAKQPQPEVS